MVKITMMKKYASNILIYISALLGIISFICLFAAPLQCKDIFKNTWVNVNVIKVYLGETQDGVVVTKSAVLPIFGFVIPFLMSIFLIIESFKPKLNARLAFINTVIAVFFLACAVLVLLTKEIYLSVNELGDTNELRNGVGPVTAGICNTLAAIILLVVTYMPGQRNIDFIEK